MREILFKAKRIDNGEWVEGYYVYVDYLDKHCIVNRIKNPHGVDFIVHMTEHDVDVNTLCQYTGLTDKNGNKIWENDVVFVTDGDGCSGSSDTGVGEIDFLLGLWYVSGSVQNGLYDVLEVIGHEAEVIGNTFDNADLLKGE